MRARLVGSWLYVVAAVLPLAGVVLIALRLSEGDRDEALRLALATVAGLFAISALVTLA